jgi:hypothetical protein
MSCEAQHAFKYTGHLTGGEVLKRRSLASILSDGRAWGAAVAAWHSAPGFSLLSSYDDAGARWLGHEALIQSMRGDVIAQRGRGVVTDFAEMIDRSERLSAIFDHYASTAGRLGGLHRLEDEINVPIPARTGSRSSSRYRFQGFLDGYLDNGTAGVDWPVEFKLRAQLTPREHIERSRQIRWYAWGLRRETGRDIGGVIVDERLNEVPKPARLVKGKKKGTFAPSHAKDQLCLPEAYIALCAEFDEDPHDDVVEVLSARDWQRRTHITFRPSELDEAGRELVSAGRLVAMLDSGDMYPVRNADKSRCSRCDYKAICSNPTDDAFIDTMFVRSVPKRLLGAVSGDSASRPRSGVGGHTRAERRSVQEQAATPESDFRPPVGSFADVRPSSPESSDTAPSGFNPFLLA